MKGKQIFDMMYFIKTDFPDHHNDSISLFLIHPKNIFVRK